MSDKVRDAMEKRERETRGEAPPKPKKEPKDQEPKVEDGGAAAGSA